MKYIEQDLPKAGDTVVVGLSGGVDSTLTALLLKNTGCHVIGVTMSLWDGKLDVDVNKTLHDSCYGPGEAQDIEQCRKFCEEQGFEYHVIDVKEAYHKEVLEYFKAEYRAGRTPNPCIRCNRYIKFGALQLGIKQLDIDYDYFCTGHYAKIVRPVEGLYGTDVRPFMISSAMDQSKDQTYFVYRVPSDVLEKVRFPLANMEKKEVFRLAKEYGLAAAEREESQDFIPEEYFDALFADKPAVPGDIVDLDGKVLGKHRGIEHYTIGQRRGLGVSSSKPLYVHSIDPKNNLVVLASNDDLNADGLIADEFVWPGNIEPKESVEAFVKIRLASKPVPAVISRYEPKNGESFKGQPWKIAFQAPQRAVAPGQSVVMYKDNVIIGGGIISKTL
ncbi:MAG: tRNA 2-thiouridine(34) synthase MnmA [Treponema sp.]|nr:tRNA 2-thiouridine(34) synthase MnmA [Spirochaetia bacterium]MDY2824338.1 tRNA 2-thiouridine(34) synthase MnmA [Treponema sp.]